jgi:hypothetical protein
LASAHDEIAATTNATIQGFRVTMREPSTRRPTDLERPP